MAVPTNLPYAKWLLPLLVLTMMSANAGCALLAHRSAVLTEGAAYPTKGKERSAVDVQVAPRGRSIVLTNTSAQPLGPGRLWLNRWYAADLDVVAIGAVVTLPLVQFHDEHGQTPPGGGFFASRAPEKIVSAELETHDAMLSFVVITAAQ